jgi:hypothetical protein
MATLGSNFQRVARSKTLTRMGDAAHVEAGVERRARPGHRPRNRCPVPRSGRAVILEAASVQAPQDGRDPWLARLLSLGGSEGQ